MKTSFWILIFLLSNSYCFAKFNCSKNGTSILYINGILTSQSEADRDARLLETIKYQGFDLYTFIDSKGDGEIIHSYNTSLGLKLDLIESAVQKLVTEKGLTRDQAWHSVYLILYESSLTAPFLAAYDLLTDEALEISKEHFDSLKQLETSDTNGLKRKIKNILSDERKLLLISHSQGGLFSNSAYLELSESNSASGEAIGETGKTFNEFKGLYRNLQIATPAARVLMDGSYVTNNFDIILNVENAAPPNIQLPLPPVFLDRRPIFEQTKNHSFALTYMNPALPFSILRAKITSTIITEAEQLISNCGKPPIADFTYKSFAGDPFAPNPLRFEFDASTSTDEDLPDQDEPSPIEPPDFDIKTFTWFIDDVLQPDQMVLTYTFLTEGSHKVRLMVTDINDNESEVLEQTIEVVNQAPVANFDYTATNLKVSFSASAASDVDGRIAEFRWKILGTEIKSFVPAIEYTFQTDGSYDVELVVVDNNGKLSAPLTKTITVGAKRGCRDPFGNLYPGKTHFNPDGSIGGYVADTSTVSGDVHVSIDSYLCGDSVLSGRIFIQGSSVENTKLESESTVFGYNRFYIGNSVVKSSNFSGENHSIYQSRIFDTTINGFNNLLTLNSISGSSSINGGFIGIISSRLENAKISRPNWNQNVLRISSSVINSSVLSTDSADEQSPLQIDSSTINQPITGWSLRIEGVTLDEAFSGSCFTVTPSGSTKITEQPWFGCP